MSRQTRSPRGNIARAALKGVAIVVGCVVVLVIGLFLLSSWAPSWWRDSSALAAEPESDRRARDLEQNLAAAVSRVRPDGEAWAIRIQDADINAWLAIRLPAWTSHDPTLAWPIPGASAQVRFEAGHAIVGLALEGRVWTGAFGLFVEPERIRIEPGSGAVGRMPVPAGAAMVAKLLEGEGATTLSLPRAYALGDGRTLELRRIDIVEGAIELEFATRHATAAATSAPR